MAPVGWQINTRTTSFPIRASRKDYFCRQYQFNASRLKMSLIACPIRLACCRDSWILFLLWLSTATVNGAVLREVHPANCTEPLGAQRGQDASMSQQDAKRRPKLLLLCTYNASGCRRRAGDGTVRRWRPVLCVRVGVSVCSPC